MKIKIKYSYHKDSIIPWLYCQADAYRRFGIFGIYTAWGASFTEARQRLMTYLHNWRNTVAKEKSRKLERKLNPPPPTEIIEI